VSKTPEQIQHDFYTATAGHYDAMHVDAEDDNAHGLALVSALIRGFGFESVLDVGAGTGRAISYLSERHPGLEVRGVEPVRALIEQAERENGVPSGVITEATGDPLPFEDQSFDVVCEFSVLHHVRDPAPIVDEMTRVARRAIFLADENRFGRGSQAYRLAKFGLHKLGLWPLAYRAVNRGRPFRLTEGDGGVSYSYSVYDSLAQVNAWADRSFLVPTDPPGTVRPGWFHPAFGSHHILLCGLRDA
jgi:SAM-dependent methyltransferase